ncbi:hypothetical protein scyTo_0013615, partial [Scyliorhinus torazame]|nr:hypothetical protein [Scyliorhinus torazame]
EPADNFEILPSTSTNLSAVLVDSEIPLQSISTDPAAPSTASEILSMSMSTQTSPTPTNRQIVLQIVSIDSFDTLIDNEMLSQPPPTEPSATLITGEILQAILTNSSPTPTENEILLWPSSTTQPSTQTDGADTEVLFQSTSTGPSTVTESEVLSQSTSTGPSTVTGSEVLSESISTDSEKLKQMHDVITTESPYVMGMTLGLLQETSPTTEPPTAYFELAIISGSSDVLSLENVSERPLLKQHPAAASFQTTDTTSWKSSTQSPPGDSRMSIDNIPEMAVTASPSILMSITTWPTTASASWQNEESLNKPLREPLVQESENSSGINLLKEFQVLSSRAVAEVEGSQPHISAFRLNPSVQLKKEIGDVHPNGIPSEYSIIATFKMLEDTSQSIWNLWDVSDTNGREQVGIRIFGDSKSLDLFYRTSYNTIMFRTFTNVDILFDGSWHKLALSVNGKEAKLLIDCMQASKVVISDQQAINGNGYTSIAKRMLDDSTVSLDLQQLELYFDPDKAFLEGCCELSDLCDKTTEYSLTGNPSPCKCSHRQPGQQDNTGRQGEKGEKGTAGKPGRPGSQGLTGYYGRVGDTGPLGVSGPPGLRGQTGAQAEKGNKGETGYEGIWGLRGVKGNKGFPGIRGRLGMKGPRGLVGDPGLPGLKGTKGKLLEIQVNQEGTEAQASRHIKDHRDYKGHKALLDPRARKDFQDHEVMRGHWEYLDQEARKGTQECLDGPGLLGILEFMVILDTQE